MTIEIRKVQKDDEESLVDICYITGDPFLKGVFPDVKLFGLFWCSYYVRFETENCFVAIDTNSNKVVGYILSSLDTKSYEKKFRKEFTMSIKNQIKNLKKRSLKAKIIAYFILHRPLSRKRKKIIEKYPAHLHINILSEYQRQGIGHRLMKRLEEHLKEKNILGFHLEVGSKNIQGINFYRKFGLNQIHKNTMNIVFAKKISDKKL